jgi:hypothetical protein
VGSQKAFLRAMVTERPPRGPSFFPSTNAHSITSSAMASIVAGLLQRLRAPVGRAPVDLGRGFFKSGWNISADPDRGSPPLA